MSEPAAQAAPPITPGDDLRAKIVSGVGWKLATQIVLQLTRIGVGILLARLLAPREFGVAAMALAFTGFASIFIDLSLGPALIQRKTLTEADRSTAFWASLAAGVACTAIGIAVAPAVAAFFSTPRVAPLFAVVAVTFTLSALSATQIALLNREMAFRSLQIREILATLFGAATALALALAGAGAWAIVAQPVAGEAIGLVLIWSLSSWRPRWTFSAASLHHLGSFSAKVLAARFFGYLNLNADNLLIGRFLGSRALGIYSVAYNVMFAPMIRFTMPVQQVLFPAFSRLQDDPVRLGRAWLRGNRLAAAITLPAFLGMAVVAPDFVPVVLGRRWEDAVPVLQFLCFAGAVLSFQPFNWSVLQARDRSGTLLTFMAISTIVIVGAFAVGLHWGIVGVAALYFAARTILLPPYTWLTCRVVECSPVEFLRSLARVVEGSIVMAGVVFALRALLEDQGVPAAARLALLVPFGIVVYVAHLRLRSRDVLMEARSLLPAATSSNRNVTSS
jgi:O-antigen/teichoic acid export membrane protein